MSEKSKKQSVNGAPAIDVQSTLKLVDFDAVVAIEPEPVSEPAPVKVEAPVVIETEEQVIAAVPSFETEFAADPLKDEIFAWAMDIKRNEDGVDKCIRFVSYGARAVALMLKRYNISPGSYNRAKVIDYFQHALTLCNVSVLTKPQEMIAVYQLVQLERSIPGGEGEARTYPADTPPNDWFGGNLHESTLRAMAKCIKRVSKDGELDCWEFKEGFEPWVRDWVKRLRDGYLSLRQVESLMVHRAKMLKHEKEQAEYAGLTAGERQSLVDNKANKERETRLTKLASLALGVQDYAATELKKGKEELREFLVNKNVIPPLPPPPTMIELAATMTPGQAKQLVQALVAGYKADPSRMDVFRVLYQQTKAIVAQMKSAQGEIAKSA
jgi:hypothetical protein